MGLRDLTFDNLPIGHSLLGFVMTIILENAVAIGGAGQVEAQIIDCAPFICRWEHSANAGAEHARRARRTGKSEIDVITEAVPLLKHLTRSDMSE
jgi:hypothetical protein